MFYATATVDTLEEDVNNVRLVSPETRYQLADVLQAYPQNVTNPEQKEFLRTVVANANVMLLVLVVISVLPDPST